MKKLLYRYFGRRLISKEVDSEIIRIAIEKAEEGHKGEIAVSIITTVPFFSNLSVRERALEEFGRLRVWDTEENTGVLLFLSIPERAVEILVDRGVNQRSPSDTWFQICGEISGKLSDGEKIQAVLENAIKQIGEELRKICPGEKLENQLKDQAHIR